MYLSFEYNLYQHLQAHPIWTPSYRFSVVDFEVDHSKFAVLWAASGFSHQGKISRPDLIFRYLSSSSKQSNCHWDLIFIWPLVFLNGVARTILNFLALRLVVTFEQLHHVLFLHRSGQNTQNFLAIPPQFL